MSFWYILVIKEFKEIKMIRGTKRYLLYKWDYDSQQNYGADTGEYIGDALNKGKLTPADYGEFVNEFDNEHEALKQSLLVADSCKDTDTAIYDSIEKIWFN